MGRDWIIGGWILGAALVAGVPPALAQEPLVRLPADGRSLSFFAGVLSTNTWHEIAFQPWDVEYTDPGLFGISGAWPIGPVFALGRGTIAFSIELQLVRHLGYQYLWETSLPLSFRYRPGKPALGVLDGFGFGIGPSYTANESPHETMMGEGEVQQSLIYWYLEMDHLIGAEKTASVFLRLHHRSDGFGLMGTSGSSNSVALGWRQAF